MGIKLRKQSATQVTPPATDHLDLFVDAADDLLKTMDSSGTVRPSSVGTADELATAGAPVDVSASSPPVPGQFLVATSPNTAAWTTVETGPATELSTTGAPVMIGTAAPPTVGQVLTATTATAATWQTPGSLSDFTTAPTTPHANDREFMSAPAGWTLYHVGTGIGTANGTLVTPTAGVPDFGLGLTTGQTRVIANPVQKRSWGVWDSFAEDQAWFYGFPLTIGASHVFRARLGVINDLIGSTPGIYGGLFQLVLVTQSGGVPGFAGTSLRLGWEYESASLKLKGGRATGATRTYPTQNLDAIKQSIPDPELVIRITGDAAQYFARTSGVTFTYGSSTGISGVGFSPGSTVWAGFLWNAMNTIAPGSKVYAADYFRQQDDAIFYG